MIVAGFDSRERLSGAVRAVREAGLGTVETYTPGKPSDDGADTAVSPIPLLMLAAGLGGYGFMMWLQIYATATSYPIDVGGRPNNSWPAYVTNAFEVGVLAAMATGFVAYLVANRMPRLYDPIDESRHIRQASRADWFLSLTLRDEAAAPRARDVLARHDPLTLEELA